MAKPILQLNGLSKIYVMGNKKNARAAYKEIGKLHKQYERDCSKSDNTKTKQDEERLKKAQALFSEEKYEESYHSLTGKSLKKRSGDRGTVVHALNGINLVINEGDLVAVMGPSGSGKSTLLNMMGLLDEPTAGQIFIKDQNISSIKEKELPAIRSKELGFVFQSFNLIPTLSALENVMIPLRYAGVSLRKRRQMAKEALEKVDMGDRLDHNPNELSGGQRQRVAIARSIVNNPAIIFGDELTGELDSKMTADVMRLIKQLNRNGQTFVIVTHNPEVARECRRTIHMKDGQVERDLVTSK